MSDRPDMPYRVFTRAFDEVVRASDLGRLLSRTPDGPYSQGIKVPDFQQRIEIAKAALKGVEDRFDGCLFDGPADESLAVAILVDQSGSNRDRMPMVAGALQYASSVLQGLGCQHAIFGFTTVGWRGGAAFRAWRGAGQEPYPGRLCALRHIVYKDFDDVTLASEDWFTFCHPGSMHENVDGEALEWAEAQLLARPERRKLLIHLSDGAPMDDATATYNGLNYLSRHLHQVAERLKSEGHVILASILVVDTEEEAQAGHNRASPNMLPDVILAAAGVQAVRSNFTTSSVE
ncbi:MAG: cobaltochelatase CobT-related protein [Novosphingobium sp.]